MGKGIRTLIAAAMASAVLGAGALPAAWATIIVDQPPTYLGGYHSDSEFLTTAGNPGWQRIADNIRLGQSAVVRRISWQGFYGGDEQSHVPPIGTETMRVRFYGSRASDGLPDELNIIYEEIFVDLERTMTGQEVFVQGNPSEFRFETNLHSELALAANSTYWLEITQLGDVNSTFRWETGFGSVPGFAHAGHLTAGEWQTFSGSMAFQLSSIPEPTTGTLLVFTLSLFLARRAPRRMPGGTHKQ